MERETLQALGWSEELISAFLEVSEQLRDTPGIDELPGCFNVDAVVTSGTFPELVDRAGDGTHITLQLIR